MSEQVIIPQWVRELFEKESPELPRPTQDNSSKEAQTVLYAKREALLAQGNIPNIKDSDTLRQEKQRLAENLLILGFYKEALDDAQTNELKSRISKVWCAIEEVDDKFCSCQDDFIDAQNGAKIPISRYRVVQEVFSRLHNKLIAVKECTKCGFVNATDYKTETEILIDEKISQSKSGQGDEKVFA